MVNCKDMGRGDDVHEEVSCNFSALGAKFVRQVLGDHLYAGFGDIICRVASAITRMMSVSFIWAPFTLKVMRKTHGGLVIPCFDPVLIINDGFSCQNMDECNTRSADEKSRT